MSTLLTQLDPGRDYGARTELLRDQTDIPGAALPIGTLAAWVRSGPLELQMRALYGGTEQILTEAEGWADRRLVCEACFLEATLSTVIYDFLAQIPRVVGEGPWIAAASASQEIYCGARWRAQSLEALHQAVRLALAESYSLQVEAGYAPDGGILILPADGNRSVDVPDPLCLNITIPSGIEQSYAFGRLYNRLLRPEGHFSYLELLCSQRDPEASRAWKEAALAAGYDPGLLEEARSALDANDGAGMSEASAVPGAGSTPLSVRQLVGTPGAPGRTEGRICFSTDPFPTLAEPLILVVHRWHRANVALPAQVAGLVEGGAGRGGAGTLAALNGGIPSISETLDTELLPENGRAILDGDTGILTVLDLPEKT